MFATVEAAQSLIAGVPAAARIARAAQGCGNADVTILAPGPWTPDASTRSEIARISTLSVHFADAFAECDEGPCSAEKFLASGSLDGLGNVPAGWSATAARRVLRETGKAGDGIVARLINRPISQAISRVLLRWPGIRPGHATVLTALVALAMALALFFDGSVGLIVGAALFQCASIVDGIDGEIARATYRVTPGGARLDSLVDAATNLAFLAGASWNLYRRGDAEAAAAGTVGLLLLGIGLSLIARRSRGGPGFNFDAVKHRVAQRPSPLRTALTWLTMRDFFSFAVAATVIGGYAEFALVVFAVVAAGWLVVVLVTMVPRPA